MIDDEMFVHYKRPSKRMKERRRHSRSGGTVLVTGTTQTINTQYSNHCDACGPSWHDNETCQNISLKRIADALEAIEEKMS